MVAPISLLIIAAADIIALTCLAPYFAWRWWRRLAPWPVIGVLTLVVLVNLWIVIKAPGLYFDSLSYLLIGGTAFSISLAAAFLLRRAFGLGVFKGILMSALPLLSLVMCLDWRFRIAVTRENGTQCRFSQVLELQRPPDFYGESYEMCAGRELPDGTMYFGLISWLRYKERWRFPPSVCTTSDGNRVDGLEFQLARWSEWPKSVTARSWRRD